jgi:hypothetical protein
MKPIKISMQNMLNLKFSGKNVCFCQEVELTSPAVAILPAEEELVVVVPEAVPEDPQEDQEVNGILPGQVE